MQNVHIQDGLGSSQKVKVTEFGQLVVAPLHYDDVVFNELAEPATGYKFYAPIDGSRFVITGIIAHADKQVGTTNGATVVVYESDEPAVVTVTKVLFQTQIGQQQTLVALPMNIIVSAGKFVNAKTDDDDVHMTITGYYI